MKFALLGHHPESLPLLRAIDASPAHQLVCGADIGQEQQEVVRHTSFRLLSDWQELLVQNVDAVIVAGDSAFALEAARHCAQTGLDLWVFPHASQGAEFVYELALARDEHPIRLVPLFPRRHHPLVVQLREAVDAGKFGAGMFVQFERHLPAARLRVEDVDGVLLGDVDLLRALFGEYEQVTAMRSGSGEVQRSSATGKQEFPEISLAQVTLAGSDVPQVTWSCQGKSAAMGWKMTVLGETATAVLSGGDDAESMSLTWNDTTETVRVESGQLLLKSVLEVAERAKPATMTVSSEMPAHAAIRDGFAWEGLIRAVEIVEATHRSIRRRRTIDLYFEAPSERSNFKSQMTAMGCGVLMFTLFAILGLLTVGAVEKEVGVRFGFNVLGQRVEMMQFLRALVFVPIGIFLLLQLLLPLTRPAASGR